MLYIKSSASIVKPVYNNHPWGSKIVDVVDRLSLFRGGVNSGLTVFINSLK